VLAHAQQDGTAGAALPVVVVLHDRGGNGVTAIEAARLRFGRRADLVAPQAARPCNPFQSNSPGAPGYAGYSWYLGDDPERPEAASFGDVLAELDLFVAALDRPFVLTGRGQGAVLATTLALHAPHALAGVFFEGAALAQIDGWTLPEQALDGVSFAAADLEDLRFSRVRESLEARGARLDRSAAEPGEWLEAVAAARASR
jgi:predicted esterase